MRYLLFRILQRFFYVLAGKQARKKTDPWRKLFPALPPSQELLNRWEHSEWDEYQHFINSHSIVTRQQWQTLHKETRTWDRVPKISIITPVYNTKPRELQECILSVKTQTLPSWELILADDGSSKQETISILQSSFCFDPRIRVIFSNKHDSHGISAASNRAIDHATGEYILFLDHDDRLAPDALQEISTALRTDPEIDVLYSDRDMISPQDKRFMHLFKPDWSPELLLSCNYFVHIMCFRTTLVEQVGKLRPDYDGSQDYDLILRCMDSSPKIKHIQKILYHWRQSEDSVALHHNAKEYAYTAGVQAIRDTCKRRNIKAEVQEMKGLWRGHYQVLLQEENRDQISRITVPADSSEQYVEFINQHSALRENTPYIFICHNDFTESSPHALEKMASWLTQEGIGMVSGCLTTPENTIQYAGMTYNFAGEPLLPYQDYPTSEPGYLGVTKILRNISAPHPYCVLIKRTLWDTLNGLRSEYTGPYSVLDFALRSLEIKHRIIYLPFAQFQCKNDYQLDLAPMSDKIVFTNTWKSWLRTGDPYYNTNFSRRSTCYELTNRHNPV